MKLDRQDIQTLCDLAVSAAKSAGEFISSRSADSLVVNRKIGGDSEASQVVTEVDRQAQEIILKTLEPTLKKYDLGLLTEESEDNHSRFDKDYFWCIDPLDGTLPFIESSPGYSVSIGLVSKQGNAQIGVVFDPVTETLYKSISNRGTYVNGISAKLHNHSVKPKLTMFSDRSFLDHPQFEKIQEGISKIADNLGYSEVELIKHGGGALNACWIIDHSPAVYFKFPKPSAGGGSLWDYAASACILKEAGGHVSNIFGKMLNLNRLDSTFMNKSGILYASDLKLAHAIISLHKALSQ